MMNESGMELWFIVGRCAGISDMGSAIKETDFNFYPPLLASAWELCESN